MMARRLLLILFLLLAAATIPAVQAVGGVDLSSTTTTLSRSVAAGTPVQVDVAYSLDLAFAGSQVLVVNSAVRSGPASTPTAHDHSATWTLGSETLQTNRVDSDTSDAAFASGMRTITVRWTLTSGTPAGTFTLHAKVEALPASCQSGGSCSVTQYDSHDVSLTLQRTATSSSSAGGGSQTESESTTSTSTTATSSPTGQATIATDTSTPTASSSATSSSSAPTPVEVRVPASPDFLATLASASNGELQVGDLLIVRDATTGVLLGLESQTQTLQNLRVAGDQDLVFLETPESGRPLVLLVGLGEVHVVQRPPVEVVQDTVASDGDFTMRVAQKSGWIEVIAPDQHSGRAIVGAVAVDGNGTEREIPLSLVWRDQGGLHLLDDPTTLYTLRFAQASSPASATTQATGEGDSLLRLALVAGAGIVLGVALAVLLVRRRR